MTRVNATSLVIERDGLGKVWGEDSRGREKGQQLRPLVKWLTSTFAVPDPFLSHLVNGFSPPQGLSSSAISFEYDTLDKNEC